MRITWFFVLLIIAKIEVDGQSDLIISKVEFTGIEKNDKSYLYNFISDWIGESYDPRRSSRDEMNLRRLSGIADARVRLDTLTDQSIGLRYEIIEQRTFIPIVGVGGIKDNFWYQLGATEFNFRGRNQSWLAYFLSNDKQPNGKFYFRNERIHGLPWGYAFELQRSASIEPLFFPTATVVYKYSNTGLGMSVIRNLNLQSFLEFGINFFVERYDKQDLVEEGSPGPDELRQDKTLIKLNYQLNRTNYDYYYREGSMWNVLTQYVYTFDDQSSFISVTFEGIRYWRPWQNTNLAMRIRAALATNEDSPFAPFVLDSQFNIRGVGNRVDRGTAQFVINAEWRQTVFDIDPWAAQIVAFSDAGSWRNPGGELSQLVDPDQFRQFIGLGVRLIYKKIFQSILRIDYGVDLFNRNQHGPVIGMGQYF